jgi:signal transduction histidine kinase
MNNIFRINVFDKNGDRVFTNREVETDDHVHQEQNVNRFKEVKPILTGEKNEMIIGLKRARHVDEQRFAVAVARTNGRGAIVVNMNAEDYMNVRNKIGIDKIIRELGNHSEIEYIVLQDSTGILAASSAINELSSFSEDEFLLNAKLNDSTFSRVTGYEERDVFETVIGLYYKDDFRGVFRIGVTLDEVRNIESRMIRRIIIISIILATITIILISVMFSNQNLDLLKREYSNYKFFTNSFLQNLKEAVVIVSSELKVTLFNNSAEKLFIINASEIVGRLLNTIDNSIFNTIAENIIIGNTYRNLDLSFELDGDKKFISLNIIPNYSLDKNLDSYTITIIDITVLKKMEEQTKRHEKLLAMGEFASSVAHEIRNPINAIGMIGQRLDREFQPIQSKDEYYTLMKLLSEEVSRVNRIITQFLQYSKPLGMKFELTDINELLKDFHHLFIEQAEQRKISFEIKGEKDLAVNIDPELFKQALVNLIQNAFEAVEDGGTIIVQYSRVDKNLVVTINDNGIGISENDRDRIFDLYFTTRNEGTGLGLTISQKIISQHDGEIDFTSSEQGTTFKIRIPLP